MNGNYLMIAGRIRSELTELQRVIQRTEQIWQQTTGTSEDYHVDAVALNLHGFYAGIERILQLIADKIDHVTPTGKNWHQELLRQMTVDIPQVRPAVLSPSTRDKLDKYRGFRHVVRHVYTFNLDPEQIALLVRQLPVTHEQVSQELWQFADLLERMAEE